MIQYLTMLSYLRNTLTRRNSSENYLPSVNQSSGRKTSVFVGVSGGVDSSVSAAILKEKGYDVTGVFIKTYYPPELLCNWRDERLDAVRVCEHLGIPFLECDMEAEYKDNVFDYMIESYRAGVTPNPDVFCNKYVKFGGFLKWSLARGADYVATGHYAQHLRSESHQLGMGKDTNKDQTYFLYQLIQEQLAHALFPIGHLEKEEVRELARKHGLFTADKKDSQGVCFVGPVDMQHFLRGYIDETPGDVLSEDGIVIGSHQGSQFLTIGQRKGFEIHPAYRTPNMQKMFIVAKDFGNNTITVSPNSQVHDPKQVMIRNVSFINTPLQVGERVQTRIRHRGALHEAVVIDIKEDCYVFAFTDSHRGVASGQSLVLYRDSICLGGGIVI